MLSKIASSLKDGRRPSVALSVLADVHEEAVFADAGDSARGGFVEFFEVDDAHAGSVKEVAQVTLGELVEVRAVFARENVLDFVDQAVVIRSD